MLDSQATSAAIYKQLFTDSEWDAISSAMGDYSDYGNEEAMIASVGRVGKKCLARIGSTAARIESHSLRDFILSDISNRPS